MKIFVCLFALLVASAAFLAADTNIAGKWSGSFLMTMDGGESHDSTVVLNLKQEGSTITGTVGPNDDQQWPIQKGKLEGDKITMDVQSEGPLVHFELVLDGEHLKGDAHASMEGKNMSAKLDATRAK
jgi:hypothetical protein